MQSTAFVSSRFSRFLPHNKQQSSKRKKRKREKSSSGGGDPNDCNNPKKCRARFGLDQQAQWCKPCRRKKKCIRFLQGDDADGDGDDNDHDSGESG